jgi:hypothetical protein
MLLFLVPPFLKKQQNVTRIKQMIENLNLYYISCGSYERKWLSLALKPETGRFNAAPAEQSPAELITPASYSWGTNQEIRYHNLSSFYFYSVPPGTCQCSTLNYAATTCIHISLKPMFSNHLSTKAIESNWLKASTYTKSHLPASLILQRTSLVWPYT